MTRHTLPDLTLACLNCGQPFVFTAGERELLQLRGVQRTPEFCAACARQQGLLVPARPSSDGDAAPLASPARVANDQRARQQHPPRQRGLT
jgi:Probable zinc-ribbon domain